MIYKPRNRMDVFSFQDYKLLLKAAIAEHRDERGYQARCAEAAGCHKTFLSQVLRGHVHLTPDHGLGLAVFWGLSPRETEYFLDLIHYERASSSRLRGFLRRRMDSARAANREVGQRLGGTRLTTPEMEAAYFSRWWISALHLALTLPDSRTVRDLVARLGLRSEVVLEGLKILEDLGFAVCKEGEWIVTEIGIHLPKDSPMCQVNHLNWRSQILNRVVLPHRDDDLNYTAIHSMAVQDFEKFRKELLDTIERTRRVVEPSAPEQLVCFTMDFVRISN